MIYRISVLVAGLLVVVSAQAQDALEAATQAAHEEIARSNDLLAKVPAGKLMYGTENSRALVLRSRQQLEDAVAREITDGRQIDRIFTLTSSLRHFNDELVKSLQAEDRKANYTFPTPTHDVIADNINLWVWVVVLVVGTFFVIPTIVAFSRRHRSRWAILVLNLVFGATLVGWIIVLIWAMNKVDDPIKGGVKLGPAPPDPIL